MMVSRYVSFGIVMALASGMSAAVVAGAVAPDLPNIRSIRIRLISMEPAPDTPARSAAPKEVVEFIVETDGQVPARAYGPALFVGDVEVNQSERVGRTTWRFLAPDPSRFRAGDTISWGWMKDPKTARQRTRFRYQLGTSGHDARFRTFPP